MAKAKAPAAQKGPPGRATSKDARGTSANSRATSTPRGAKAAAKPAAMKVEKVETLEEDKPEKVHYEDIKHKVL